MQQSKSKVARKSWAAGNNPTDEVYPKEVYNKARSDSSPPQSAAPPSTSRKPAFDYYTLEYDDLSDPD